MWRSRALLRPAIRTVLNPSHRRLQSRSSSPDDVPYPQTHSIQQGFAQHPIFVFNVAKRFIKFSFIGLIILGSTTAVAFEAAHTWVENVELKKEKEDPEVSAWEWDSDAEKWNGDDKQGGTDPGLGFRGRHCVRGAWVALHWGVGESTAVIGSDASNTSDGLLGPRGLIIIDPRLVRAEDSLRTAVEIAEQKNIQGKLQPWTLSRLLSLHASVLERMGVESSLVAKEQYERAWAAQPQFTKQSARLAMKLGDLCFRIGDNDSAMTWWARGAYLTGQTSIPSETPEFPASSLQNMPSSPSAQRTLLSILASCSASYARSAKFKQGRSLDEAAFDLVRSVRHPENMSSVSPAHALHALTLLHRSSVFCIHRAEVSHALKEKPSVSIQWLSTAAQSSERVARALVISSNHSGSNNSLSPLYTDVPALKLPAIRLLREARRTAAEAWNLLGILNENKNKQEALQCYKHAVEWASKPDIFGEPAEETLVADWEVVWGNYTRLSGRV
ncbi:hypothetical protein L218DRAFT_957897 [Marasmius fiardii PR-910]|nr:hypothetical protein L218DRAFT_957897 [Marasmius fiardii PR-910]